MRTFLFLALSLIAKKSISQATDSMVLKNAVLYYYTYGNGQPVIILSGGPGVASHQEDDVAAELGKKYQVILFDQRGTGRSWTKPMDNTTINIKQAVADLDSLRSRLHIKKLTLYGHSWGSMLAAAYIASHPERVQLFISVCGGEIDTDLTPTVNHNVDATKQLGDTLQYMHWRDPTVIADDPKKAAYQVRRMAVRGSIYDTTKLDQVMEQVSHGERNTLMGKLMWTSIKKDLHFSQAGKNYKGKALVIFGWNDMISLTTVTQYQQAFPQAQIKGVYNSGHYPEVEQPASFYPVVLQFLTDNL